MNEKIKKRNYINPQSYEIVTFTNKMKENTQTLEDLIYNIFKWFNDNVDYSRLEQPYFPLQRNDLEVLEMKAGTCGDFSNLIVSVLVNMGVPVKYAYLKRDCYGDEQDHICVAIEVNGKWVLIDATNPYRKWYGYNCPHEEYDLYDIKEFEDMMKKTEEDLYEKALKIGEEKLAGLLYAPWIYDETVINTDDRLESVFYLLQLENVTSWTLWISYMVYTSQKGYIPFVMRIDENLEKWVMFSEKEPETLWDDNQWGDEYSIEDTPDNYRTIEFDRCLMSVNKNIDKIKSIIMNCANT